MTALSVSEARASLPALLDQVEQGAEITITRHGHPVAVVVRPDVLRARRSSGVWADVERIGTLLDAARPERARRGQLTNARAEALVAEIRAGRDAR
jgi:antitoxin (DNA-binding transcriptional repressor) of toxin-antitoxin stability system